MAEPKVSVCMITYNHESYIQEAIEGVLLQKTNFPIELIIGEDCSTDNTRQIVKEYEEKYPEIIIAQYPNSNRGMVNNFLNVLQSTRGKYIAICEGDDYWSDPLKLQKQADFLERNEECVVCGTRFLEEKVQNGKKIHANGRGHPDNLMFYYKDILYGRVPFQTCSLMVRKNTIGNIEIPKGVLTGDKLLLMNVLKHGGFGVILPDITCVYRIHPGGVWSGSGKTKTLLSYFNLFNSYKKIIPKIYHKDARKLRGYYSLRLLINHLKEGEWAHARKYIKFLRPDYSSLRVLYYEFFKKKQNEKAKVYEK